MDSLYTVIRSGLVVSGNGSITVAKQLTSGDAMQSFRISGAEHLIGLRQGRSESLGILGGKFTQIADYVDVDLFVHYTYATTSSVLTPLRRLVDDFKITIASGSFTNPARPILVAESWPMAHEKNAKATLSYRFRYLL